jgi:hypothetical protein
LASGAYIKLTLLSITKVKRCAMVDTGMTLEHTTRGGYKKED